MFKKYLSGALMLFVVAQFTAGQILDPVSWSFSTEKVSDAEYDLVLAASIDDKWHLYSQDLPGGGPIPTSFVFEESDAWEAIGEVKEVSEAEVKYDAAFDMDLKMYSNEAIFKQRVRVNSTEDVNVTGYLEFMCCDDETCLPPKEVEFSFSLPGTPAGAAATSPDQASGAEEAATEAGKEPAAAGDTETSAEDDGKPAVEGDAALAIKRAAAGLEAPEGETETERLQSAPGIDPSGIDYEEKTAGKDNQGSLWVFFLVAFVAGLAAILTPCVFPMIPMTVTFFMQGSEHRARAILKGLIFGISIVAIYTSIGFLVSLTSAGADVANQVSTHWIPNLIFFVIFMIFAASFFGMFELVLPSKWVNRTDKQVDKGGFLASFFMAFTLVLVSFSCTGPIVGALLVESVGGLALKPILGMFGFSLAFALPFTLLAIFPSWLSGLPKSGGWLNAVKVVLGFIVLAFGFKFLSTMDQTYHLGILSRDVYLALWIVIFTLLGFYLLGKIRFAHDSDLPHISVPRLVLAIATFTFVVYMIPGLFGAQLSAISALIPPRTSQNFDLTSVQGSPGAVSGDAFATASDELCGPATHSGFLHLPHGLQGYFDYEEGMACAIEKGKPVFLDFTGHACSNCKEMHGKVWSHPEVLKRLRNDYVIIALYTDDRTKLPESEWVTTPEGKVLKTIGKINADFEIRHFNTNTQPLYALLDHEGNLLTGTRGHDLNVQRFIDFLDRGSEEFNAQ